MTLNAKWTGRLCGTDSLRNAKLNDVDDNTIGLFADDLYDQLTVRALFSEDPGHYLSSCQPDVDGAVSSDTADGEGDYHLYTPSPTSFSLFAYDDSEQKLTFDTGTNTGTYTYHYLNNAQECFGPTNWLQQPFSGSGLTNYFYIDSGEAGYTYDNGTMLSDGFHMLRASNGPITMVGFKAYSTLSTPTTIHTEPATWKGDETHIIAAIRYASNILVLYTAIASGSDFEIVLKTFMWNTTTKVLDLKDTFNTGMIAPGTHVAQMYPGLLAEFDKDGYHFLLVGFPFYSGSKPENGQVRAYSLNTTTGVLTYYNTQDPIVAERYGHWGVQISAVTEDDSSDFYWPWDIYLVGGGDLTDSIEGGLNWGTVNYSLDVRGSDQGAALVIHGATGLTKDDSADRFMHQWSGGYYEFGPSYATYAGASWYGAIVGVNNGIIASSWRTEYNPDYCGEWLSFMYGDYDCQIVMQSAVSSSEVDQINILTLHSGASVADILKADATAGYENNMAVIVDTKNSAISFTRMGLPQPNYWARQTGFGSTHMTGDHTTAVMFPDPDLGFVVVNIGRLGTDTTKVVYDVFELDFTGVSIGIGTLVYDHGPCNVRRTTALDVTSYGLVSLNTTWGATGSAIDRVRWYSFDGLLWSNNKNVAPQYTPAQAMALHFADPTAVLALEDVIDIDVSAETDFYFMITMRRDGINEGSMDYWTDNRLYRQDVRRDPTVLEREIMLNGCSNHPFTSDGRINANATGLQHLLEHDDASGETKQYEHFCVGNVNLIPD